MQNSYCDHRNFDSVNLVLLQEETRAPGRNHCAVESNWKHSSHKQRRRNYDPITAYLSPKTHTDLCFTNTICPMQCRRKQIVIWEEGDLFIGNYLSKFFSIEDFRHSIVTPNHSFHFYEIEFDDPAMCSLNYLIL
jgi:hypothetical protein